MTPNDTTIIYSLSILPGITTNEVISSIDNLDDQSKRNVCLVLAGLKNLSDLSTEEQNDYYYLSNWAKEKRERLRNEESSKKNSKIALRLNNLVKSGVVNESVLFLFGISGRLPNTEEYHSWSEDDRRNFWSERVQSRLGPRSDINSKLKLKPNSQKIMWEKEGF